MSGKFNLGIIDEIAEKNLNMNMEINNREMRLDDIKDIEQATLFIKDHDSKIANSWFQLSHALKKVRDERLYEGKYGSFQEYYTSEFKYAETAVYNFIKIAESFPIDTKDNLIELGVTKLLSLTKLDEEKREEFIEENNLSEMSAKEISRKSKEHGETKVPNYDMSFNLDPDEHTTVRNLYGNVNRFQHVVGELAFNRTDEIILTPQQIIYLQDAMKKTKKDIIKMEIIIKKYL